MVHADVTTLLNGRSGTKVKVQYTSGGLAQRCGTADAEIKPTTAPSKELQLTLWLSDAGRAQDICESRGGPPGVSVQTSLMVSVDVKQY